MIKLNQDQQQESVSQLHKRRAAHKAQVLRQHGITPGTKMQVRPQARTDDDKPAA